MSKSNTAATSGKAAQAEFLRRCIAESCVDPDVSLQLERSYARPEMGETVYSYFSRKIRHGNGYGGKYYPSNINLVPPWHRSAAIY